MKKKFLYLSLGLACMLIIIFAGNYWIGYLENLDKEYIVQENKGLNL